LVATFDGIDEVGVQGSDKVTAIPATSGLGRSEKILANENNHGLA
jgi:hypothetical protein